MLIFIKFDKRYLVAALLPYFFIMYFDFKGNIAAFLGNISYSLYLVHIPIGGRIINISEVLFADALMRDLMVFAALAISIFSAWVFYLFIEKPAILWAKRIKYKEKDNSP
jgi:peptidoglycan/LPS O-acetylase OafA/YrhL